MSSSTTNNEHDGMTEAADIELTALATEKFDELVLELVAESFNGSDREYDDDDPDALDKWIDAETSRADHVKKRIREHLNATI